MFSVFSIVLRKAKRFIQSFTLYQAFIVYKYPTSKFKKHFILDLAKSGRSGQYMAGTGSGKKWPDRLEPEPDFWDCGRSAELTVPD